MGIYRVRWSKTYISSGEVDIVAESQEHAREIVNDNIGSYTGSMQYDPEQDEIDVQPDELLLGFELIDEDDCVIRFFVEGVRTSKKETLMLLPRLNGSVDRARRLAKKVLADIEDNRELWDTNYAEDDD